MDESSGKHSKDTEDFEAKSRLEEPSFFAELLEFLRDNKRWWLWPIVLSFLALGLLVALNGTGAAPFIYAFF